MEDVDKLYLFQQQGINNGIDQCQSAQKQTGQSIRVVREELDGSQDRPPISRPDEATSYQRP